LLPRFFIAILMIGMIIGGCTVSTAGGIKVFRFSILTKSVGWLLRKLGSPSRAVIPFQIDKKPIDETDRLIVHGYFFSYLSILMIGTLIFLLLGYSLLDSSFQMVSALGTVGLSTLQLQGVSWVGKTVLIVAMLLGRLEIFPLLIVIRRFVRTVRYRTKSPE
jgi:trk system potassium uptake protein TrkH